jgi:putative aldouronate transport system permease protein
VIGVSGRKTGGVRGRFRKEVDLLGRDLIRNRMIYFMLLPVVLYFAVFHYIPLYGAQIAFRDFSPTKGILKSAWVGLKHFSDFFSSYYFWRLVRNTLLINVYDLVFAFPAPIILALLLNEIRGRFFKRSIQTFTYLPHFVSMVVICGMIIDFLSRDGIINNLLNLAGIQTIPFMTEPKWFRAVYVSTNIWQEVGWSSIIYLAALTAIDPELYEAAEMDGAKRFRKFWHITLPGIMATIIIMLILRMGRMMTVGFEKVLLLYNPSTYETADVVSTFVYRKGILEASYSYSAAVGLFNSVINFAMLLTMNSLCRKITETSLW